MQSSPASSVSVKPLRLSSLFPSCQNAIQLTNFLVYLLDLVTQLLDKDTPSAEEMTLNSSFWDEHWALYNQGLQSYTLLL